ncbi:hypothetical protein BH11PSE10_BH11PSE10_13440 [soil metagenome]
MRNDTPQGAAFSEVWEALRQSGKPPPYLLIDCAGIEGGEQNLPKPIFDELECLFTGDLAEELADVGPYLGRLANYAPETMQAVHALLLAQVGILVLPAAKENPLEAPDAFSVLHRHFRKFNVVYEKSGKPLFFRYYDSRIFKLILSVLTASQLTAFFGVVDQFLVIDETDRLARFGISAGALSESS